MKVGVQEKSQEDTHGVQESLGAEGSLRRAGLS